MSWRQDRYRHSLAARGIRTAMIGKMGALADIKLLHMASLSGSGLTVPGGKDPDFAGPAATSESVNRYKRDPDYRYLFLKGMGPHLQESTLRYFQPSVAERLQKNKAMAKELLRLDPNMSAEKLYGLLNLYDFNNYSMDMRSRMGSPLPSSVVLDPSNYVHKKYIEGTVNDEIEQLAFDQNRWSTQMKQLDRDLQSRKIMQERGLEVPRRISPAAEQNIEVFMRKTFAAKERYASAKRKAMAYVPTYGVGDISLIGADAIGTAGATAVTLIPLAVGAGVLYGSTKYIKKKYYKKRKRR